MDYCLDNGDLINERTVCLFVLHITSGYLEMQDLLQDFDSPSVMDCKMGTRYIANYNYSITLFIFCGVRTRTTL